MYLLRKFPSKLLDKTHLEEYASTNELPYLERLAQLTHHFTQVSATYIVLLIYSYSNTDPDDVFDISKDQLWRNNLSIV